MILLENVRRYVIIHRNRKMRHNVMMKQTTTKTEKTKSFYCEILDNKHNNTEFTKPKANIKWELIVKTARRTAKPKIMHNSNIRISKTQKASVHINTASHSVPSGPSSFEHNVVHRWCYRRCCSSNHIGWNNNQKTKNIFMRQWQWSVFFYCVRRGINIYYEWKLFHCEKWPHSFAA